MNVGEIVAELLKLDQASEVLIGDPSGSGYWTKATSVRVLGSEDVLSDDEDCIGTVGITHY